MRTSPPRTFDIEQRYPTLANWRRTATRLHPRPGDPGVQDSSIGGPLLWPSGEEWPVCTAEDHYGDDKAAMATVAHTRSQRLLYETRNRLRGLREDTTEVSAQLEAERLADRAVVDRPRGTRPFIGVAQLYVRDVPHLRHPEGADLLQVLWCPHMHEEAEYLPRVRLVWRDSAAVTETVDDPSPQVVAGDEGFVPEICVVHPEELVEYPPTHCAGLELPADVVDYDDREALATGWKVGGWGDYCGVVDPMVPDCECGATTEAFLTVGNGEWSTDDGRWRPLEDAEFTPTLWHPTDWDPVQTYVGRGYIMQLFQCAKGFDCPVTTRMT